MVFPYETLRAQKNLQKLAVFSMEKNYQKLEQFFSWFFPWKKTAKTKHFFSKFILLINFQQDMISSFPFQSSTLHRESQKFWRSWNERRRKMFWKYFAWRLNSFHATFSSLELDNHCHLHATSTGGLMQRKLWRLKRKLKHWVDTWNRPLFRQAGMTAHEWHNTNCSSRKFFNLKWSLWGSVCMRVASFRSNMKQNFDKLFQEFARSDWIGKLF